MMIMPVCACGFYMNPPKQQKKVENKNKKKVKNDLTKSQFDVILTLSKERIGI